MFSRPHLNIHSAHFICLLRHQRTDVARIMFDQHRYKHGARCQKIFSWSPDVKKDTDGARCLNLSFTGRLVTDVCTTFLGFDVPDSRGPTKRCTVNGEEPPATICSGHLQRGIHSSRPTDASSEIKVDSVSCTYRPVPDQLHLPTPRCCARLAHARCVALLIVSASGSRVPIAHDARIATPQHVLGLRNMHHSGKMITILSPEGLHL